MKITCNTCGYTFLKSIEDEVYAHESYHNRFKVAIRKNGEGHLLPINRVIDEESKAYSLLRSDDYNLQIEGCKKLLKAEYSKYFFYNKPAKSFTAFIKILFQKEWIQQELDNMKGFIEEYYQVNLQRQED